ncbi:Lactose permease [Paramyrothecium foliicola]|nr:Lactose permease [Paramyrothecium foliicola]
MAVSMSDDKHPADQASESRLESAHQPQRLADVVPVLDAPWWKVPHLLKLNLLLLVPLISSYISGFDGSMLNGMQSLPVWQEDLNYPRGAVLGLISTMQVIGAVASLPIAPYLSDRFGRRHPIFFGSLILIFGAAIQGGANGIGMFLAGRALVGFGGGIVPTAAAPLIAELAYPTQRPIITAIYNTSWYLGSIVAAWMTYGTFRLPNSWSWRIPSLMQAAPSLLQLAFVYLLPESPRWLVAHEQHEKARDVLLKHHAAGDEDSQLVQWEMVEIQAAIEKEKAQDTASYTHFFKTPGNRRRFLICVALGFLIQWCGNGLVSFYLVPVLNSIGITDPETQNLINGILQICNYLVALSAAFGIDRAGRRLMFLVSIAGMALCFVIWTALSATHERQQMQNKGLGIGIVCMIFFFFFFYNIAMSPIPVAYLLEILPFTLRAKGLTIFNTAQFSSSIFNNFVNPVALDAIGWRYYIVFICVLSTWFFVVWFLFPETKGLSLEEVSIIFDGDGALDGTITKTVDKSND